MFIFRYTLLKVQLSPITVDHFPGDKDYISPCDHEHKERYDRCDILPRVVDEIQSALGKIDDGAEKDEMKFQGEQSMQKN